MTSGRRALALYSGSGAATRAHVWGRWATCPFPVVAQEVPDAGRVLEVGCGHGLFSCYLALQSTQRQVHGVDLDADKIRDAAAAAHRAAQQGASVSFAVAPSGAVPPGPWDAVVIVDVLYLLDRDGQRRLLAACAASLAPGGVLVVKEVGLVPRWKYRWNQLQETVSVRVLGITHGRELTFTSPDELAGVMRDAGLTVTANRRVDRGRPHPHHLVVGRAPTDVPAVPG